MRKYSKLILFVLGFPTGRDSGTAKTFLSRDKGTTGQKFLHCPGTKGQRDKLKILPRDGTGQPKPGTGRAGIAKIRDGARDKTGQSRKGCSKTERDVLEQKRMF